MCSGLYLYLRRPQEGQSFCQPLLHSKFQANLGYIRLSLCMFSFTSAITILKVKRELISSLVGYLSRLWFSLLSCTIGKNRKAMFCPLTVSSGLGADIGSSSYNWALIACLLKFILTHKNIFFIVIIITFECGGLKPRALHVGETTTELHPLPFGITL